MLCHMAAPALSLDDLASLLGLKRAQRYHSRLDLIPLVRKGLPYQALERVGGRLDMSVETTAKFLRLPVRTLARRKETGTLDANQSEKLLRLAEIGARAVDVFGDVDKARAWLQRPNRALGGVAPLSILDTGIGAEEVLTVLGRIEYGVFS